jgi:hypothetical protein
MEPQQQPENGLRDTAAHHVSVGSLQPPRLPAAYRRFADADAATHQKNDIRPPPVGDLPQEFRRTYPQAWLAAVIEAPRCDPRNAEADHGGQPTNCHWLAQAACDPVRLGTDLSQDGSFRDCLLFELCCIVQEVKPQLNRSCAGSMSPPPRPPSCGVLAKGAR